MNELINKLKSEKEEHSKAVKLANDRLNQEARHREKLQHENDSLRKSLNAVKGGNGGGLTYEQIQARCKELENDCIILRCQMKPVVVYNKEQGTFEYLSQPI